MICFAHISDLHFGDRLANSGRGLILHQRPHDLVKCLQLPSGINLAMDEAKVPDNAELRVIASGDLSVAGSAQQLAVSHAFLRSNVSISRLPAPYGIMGLGITSENLGAIPGNHDHWSGNRSTLCPYNRNLFDEHFRYTPWVKTWGSVEGDFELDVFGVDSNSGWDPMSAGAVRHFHGGLLSQGRISDMEFDALRTKLVNSSCKSVPTVRAIVCHHSVCYKGGLLGKLELEAASRDRLLELAGEFRVAVILTGHTHDSHSHPEHRPDLNGNVWAVWELRCASTVGWPDSPTDESGFLFHRITASHDQWTWTTWRFGWDGSGFAVSTKNPWETFDGSF